MIQAILSRVAPFQKRLIVLVLLSTVPGRGGAELRVGLSCAAQSLDVLLLTSAVRSSNANANARIPCSCLTVE